MQSTFEEECEVHLKENVKYIWGKNVKYLLWQSIKSEATLLYERKWNPRHYILMLRSLWKLCEALKQCNLKFCSMNKRQISASLENKIRPLCRPNIESLRHLILEVVEGWLGVWKSDHLVTTDQFDLDFLLTKGFYKERIVGFSPCRFCPDHWPNL